VTPARDRILVDSQAVGRRPRSGEIVEVLGDAEHPRYRVRWEDGRETIVYPGSDTHVSLARRRGGSAPPPRAAARRPRRPPRAAARPPQQAGLTAVAGDRLLIRSHRLGEPPRDAEILEVLGDGGGPPFRVRWDDTGAESLFFPGNDAHVEHFQAGKRRRRRPATG
jgi:Domain of unknown function (DUF1918)